MKRAVLITLMMAVFPFVCAQATQTNPVIRKPSKIRVLPKSQAELPKIKPVEFHTPDIKEITTPKGIKAWLVEEKDAPLFSVSVIFRGGQASDPERLTGLTELAVSLLDEGAGSLNAKEFQERLAQNGITVSFDATADTVTASLTALPEHKKEAFDLFRLALTKPRFDRKAVKRVKEQMYAVIKARKGRPEDMAQKRWNELVFKGHPYSRVLPTKEGVEAVGRSNLKRFVKTRFAKDNLIISVAGNISEQDLIPLLDDTFGELPEKSDVLPVLPFSPQRKKGIDVLTMDIPQSATVFGHKGIARNDPDFYSALVLMHIFGSGGMSSRLFNAVREEKGLAYSVGAGLSVRPNAPMVIGEAASENSKLSQAIEIIKNEWKKMAEDGPTPQELKDAKTYLTGSFPLTFSSTPSMAAFLSGMQYHGLSPDYLKRRNSLIEAVTIDDARKTAKRIMDPESLFFVVVGKPANL